MRWPRSWVNHARLLCTFFFFLFGEHQDYFARLPDLRVVEYTPAPVRVYGDFAAQAGTYTFSWQGTAGDTVEMRSRFSFTFRRDNPGSAQAWTIVEHHSSNMPTSPLELELTQVSKRHSYSMACGGRHFCCDRRVAVELLRNLARDVHDVFSCAMTTHVCALT